MDQRDRYIRAINSVIDYIEENISEELKLDKLAEVADFSVYHFHRIFQAYMNEPLGSFVKRIRLEKAAVLLINHPSRSVTDIAMDVGYWSSQAFARAFRDRFKMSSSEYRDSKNSYMDDKKGNDKLSLSGYHASDDDNSERRWKKNMNIDIKDLPEMTLAYIRNVGPYAEDSELFSSLFGKVRKWAEPKGLLGRQGTYFIAVYHDCLEITGEEKRRISVGITVPEGTKGSGKINTMKIPAGKYAIAHLVIDQGEYQESWDKVYCEWLPESGYEPDDRPCFEIYLNDPKTHPEGKHIVDICVPISKA
ncbi:AraC family transcriptional regulator [Patescibacteria group bacterium]|nr:AraC family transcriptional regulator [Patescibacteria group bacterium]